MFGRKKVPTLHVPEMLDMGLHLMAIDTIYGEAIREHDANMPRGYQDRWYDTKGRVLVDWDGTEYYYDEDGTCHVHGR